MTARRKCLNFTEGVDEDHFYVQSFSSLARNLTASDNHVTPKELASVVLIVRQFMEEKFGRGTCKPRSCTKLPHSIFHDFSINGPLFSFFKNIFTFLKSRSLFLSDIKLENANLLEDLVKSSYALLLQEGHIRKPVVFFNKVPVGLINTLSRIVTEHYGEITSSEESATHVINWNDEVDNFPEELTEDFIRILETKQVKGEGFAFVHWWYYPDCYDEWLSGSEVNPSDPPDISSTVAPKTKWNVCCRFILDCEVFNEWGNEIDYENDGSADEQNNDLSALNSKKSRNRKKANALGVKPPKEAPILEAISATEKILSDMLPPSLCLDVIPTVIMTVPPENTPQDIPQFTNTNIRGVDCNSGNSLKRKFSGDTNPQTEKIAVKGPPSWFNPNSINMLEFVHLGKQLSLSSSEGNEDCRANANYLRIRSFMIGLYELNTSQQLSVTECRRKIAGDVSVLIKVYEFLNAYGIINYAVKAESRTPTYLQFPVPTIPIVSNSVIDEQLMALASEHNGDWQAVAIALGNRLSPIECAAKFGMLSNVGNRVSHGETITNLNRYSWLVGSEVPSFKISIACVNEIADLVVKQNILLQKYMENRQLIVEEKLKLLTNVENLVEIKREELDVERKDLQIHGAQLASLRSQNAAVNQISV